MRKLRTECEDYLIIDNVLFRIKRPKDKSLEPSLLLVIPESNVATILYQYHDSLLAGHQGVTRMYLTIKEKFYANNLFNPIRKYVQSCHTCHTRSAKEPGYKAYHTRIPYDFRPMSRVSADIKWMPLTNQVFNYILFATCEISNYVVGIPIQKANVLTIAEALLYRVVYQFGPPKTLIIDEDRTLSADVLMHIYNTLNIRSHVISPLNHGSLRTERYIRSISEMLCKHLKTTSEDWHLYVNPCCYALNTYVSPSAVYSAYDLVYLHKPADLAQIDYSPLQHMSRSLDDYMKILKKRFYVMKRVVLDKKKTHDQSVQQIRQNRTFPRNQTFAVGDLVYLFAPSVATLQTRSRKFKEDWIGPLQVKPCYLNLGKVKNKVLATVSNIQRLKNELEAFEPL